MLAECSSGSSSDTIVQESLGTPRVVDSSSFSTAAAATTISSRSINRSSAGTICKYIRNKQICPYGSACRFRHPQQSPPVCRMFLASRCTYGDQCRYSHQPPPDHSSSRDSHQLCSLSSFPSLSSDVSKHKKPQQQRHSPQQRHLPQQRHSPQQQGQQQGSRQRSRRGQDGGSSDAVNLGAYFERATAISSRPHVSRLGPRQQQGSLRDVECNQLEKRFPQYTLVHKDREEITYSITYTPTDPQWQLDALMLTVTFPSGYPREVVQLRVTGGQSSLCCLERVNSALKDRIDEMFLNSKLSGQYELMFRPVLRWLDSHVTSLVAACYCHYQQQQEEEEVEELSHEEEEVSTSDEEQEEEEKVLGWSKPLKKGTELRLQGVKLSQSVATLQCTRARLSIQCTRCRHVMDITCGQKQLSADCDHCHQCYSISYHSDIIHASNTTMGFVDLLGCQVFDVILSSCECVVVCLECNKEAPVHGLSYGQPVTSWCGNCHTKLCMAIEEVKFYSHQLSDSIVAACGSTVSGAKKKKKEPQLYQEGKPLPNTGTCDHYKKSHRWLRFPCCGKVYPCDVCHDSTEDHIMERAKRMICGYCSKEQPYTGDRPCVLCGSNMTGSNKSTYWDGGQGCRNKAMMSRNDSHKYSGANKIASKKNERVGSKSKSNRATS